MVDKLCHIPLLPESSVPLEVERNVVNTKKEPFTAADAVRVVSVRTLLDTNKWYGMQ
jgi:hypothetical protein